VIGLDTNVLLRVFIDDDASQHARASAFLLAHRSVPGESPLLFVSPIVLCEVVWALDSIYRRPKAEILGILEAIQASRDIEISEVGAVQAATRRFREGKGDFADYYILEAATRAGCESVATFDGPLLKETGFSSV
jgi:predicted nucleic-acid-binding protein